MNRNLERLTPCGWCFVTGTLIGAGIGGVIAGIPLAWVTVVTGVAVGVVGLVQRSQPNKITCRQLARKIARGEQWEPAAQPPRRRTSDEQRD